VKPKIFIGSSGEARDFALAIHAELQHVAECTAWTEGAFGLSENSVESLMRNLRESDFGIFVFAADDVATLRGDLLNVPRDNVVFEAGLFSGYLGPKRCFFVIPQSTPIHIPSDLLGLTLGQYEDNRSDGNTRAAVATFCDAVRKRVALDGVFEGAPHERLRELCMKFECCDWITDTDQRVERKKAVSSEIDTFCSAQPVNKHRLLMRHHIGYYIALLSAIRLRPDERDWQLITQMKQERIPSGFAYYRLLDAAEALKTGGCKRQHLSLLQAWLKALRDADGSITKRIDALVI
jgi:hypothetical protein